MQTPLESLIEAITNTVIGFAINYVANLVILPMYGCYISYAATFTMGIIYTLVSVARQYAIRRWFETTLKQFNKQLAERVREFFHVSQR